MARFLVDENLSPRLAEVLRSLGHDAVSVSELRMTSADDERIADIAERENRILITFDLDFTHHFHMQRLSHIGTIVLRLKNQRAVAVRSVLQNAVNEELLRNIMPGTLVIVDEATTRFRTLL